MKKSCMRLFTCCLFISANIISFGQQPSKQAQQQAQVQSLIDAQKYIFHAQQASPLGGGTRQLTTDYDMRVTPDSVTTYLPYFGRAYQLPYNPTDGGINLLTTKFDYQKTLRKKGGWEITIKPTERMDVQQLFLTVSENGYATLRVTCLNRQPISFYGYVGKGKM